MAWYDINSMNGTEIRAGEKQMDRKLLYDNFAQFEEDTALSLERLRNLKSDVEKLMEENTALHIENQYLRERLDELEKQNAKELEPTSPEMTKSRLNLEKIYEEGFHVCNLFYGSRRVEDEPCAFCLDVIYGERK